MARAFERYPGALFRPINTDAIGQLYKLSRIVVTGPAVDDSATC